MAQNYYPYIILTQAISLHIFNSIPHPNILDKFLIELIVFRKSLV